MKTVKTIGVNSNQPVGRGFNFPYDLAIKETPDKSRILYLLNRTNSASRIGTRIQYFTYEETWLGEFGNPLDNDAAQLSRPVAMAFNSTDELHVTDEATDEIKIFDNEGKYLRAITLAREVNSSDSLPFGPAGITIDTNDNIYVTSRYLGIVQKLSPSGNIIFQWGGNGSKEGEFDMPWGIAIDLEGSLYIADWRNDRIQKFDKDGIFLRSYGQPGQAPGQLNRPSSVAVDPSGNIAIADWGNERVQIFGSNGNIPSVLEGDATLSQWSHEWLNVNLDEREARNRANLRTLDLPKHLGSSYHESSQTEHKFWGPVSVKFDVEGQLYVTEHSRHRIQVFEPVGEIN
ncbi:MAG: NHL repeat-containing protein [SAR202 cluster bacterium]|nr:NHL repeat-containing protein [SAR202 cluster bacterium]